MSTEIYYFTATGNSLAVARDIAERLDGSLISVASMMGKKIITTDAEAIGIAFPAYYASFGGSGIPLIIKRFVRKLEGLDKKYFFAVCTHGGMPGDTIANLSKLIEAKGGRLDAGFEAHMSIPYAAGEKMRHALFCKELRVDDPTENEKRQKLFCAWTKNLEIIQKCVGARENNRPKPQGKAMRAIIAPLLSLNRRAALSRYQSLSGSSALSLDELIPLADDGFRLAETCNGCGTCAKICPVGNIEMVDGGPVWRHRCETCYACYQWCPKAAIHGPIVEYEKRYHHPGTGLSDILRQAAGNQTSEGENMDGSILRTRRLSLRYLNQSDIGFLVDLWSDENMTKYTGGPRDRAFLLEEFSRAARNPTEEEYDLWAIELLENGEIIGQAGFIPKEIEGETYIELNYYISEARAGKGYATEIAEQLIEYVFSNKNETRIIAIIEPDNGASKRVAEKIGMKYWKSMTRETGAEKLVYAIQKEPR